MFWVAWGFGLASFLTFFLGMVGKLTLPWLWLPLTVFVTSLGYQGWQSRFKVKPFFQKVARKRISLVLLALLGITSLGYGWGLLGPETSFDALWYHLTLPKLYLQEGVIHFFPGGLLYYSAMPQAMEMIYLLGLAFGGQTLARLFHFLFGVFSAGATYRLARRFTSLQWALVAALIFYSQLTVGWESSAAYVDLTRTFLETSALLAFFSWHAHRNRKWLLVAGALLGLAGSVKLLSLGTGGVVLALVVWQSRTKLKDALTLLVPLTTLAILWLIYGRWQTGVWLYPLLSHNFQQTLTVGQGMSQWFLSRTPAALAEAVWRFSFTQGDILTPVFLIGLPFLLGKIYKNSSVRVLGVYLALNFLVWFVTPVNYNRFFLPFTPALATLMVIAFAQQSKSIRSIFIGTVLVVALLNLGVTGIRSLRPLQYLMSGRDMQAYLDRHLKPELGNLGAAGNFLEKETPTGQKVLVVGGHNLFYMPVAFDHESWADSGTDYAYLVVWGQEVPERFRSWSQVFADTKTGVMIYQENDE